MQLSTGSVYFVLHPKSSWTRSGRRFRHVLVTALTAPTYSTKFSTLNCNTAFLQTKIPKALTVCGIRQDGAASEASRRQAQARGRCAPRRRSVSDMISLEQFRCKYYPLGETCMAMNLHTASRLFVVSIHNLFIGERWVYLFNLMTVYCCLNRNKSETFINVHKDATLMQSASEIILIHGR